MNGWLIKTLAEACVIKPSKGEARDTLSGDSPVSFVPMEDLGIGEKFVQAKQTRHLSDVVGNYTYFAQGDVLLAKITPCFENGKLGIADRLVNGIGFGSSEYMVFRPVGGLSQEWLYYYLSREAFRVEGAAQMSGAVGHRRISKEFVESYPIPIPPLAEQHRIVSILDKAFSAMETSKVNAEKNLQSTHALFDSYLVSVFSQRGEGWVEKRVSDIARHSLGKMLDRAKNKGELRPYLRNLNVRWFAFDLSDLAEMPFLPEETGKYTAVNGDILICEGGAYPGRAAIWREDYPIFFQKALHRVRLRDPEYNEWFVYYLYAQEQSGKLEQHLTGTGIPHFTGKALAEFLIPLPPKPQVRAAIDKIDALAEETRRLESIYRRKLQSLDELKQSLLHQAFTGQL